ncbi:hypothetical protein CASFOL_029118 [Castilleja foliolosa]|uniref:Tetraspanin-19 n=1 Tax=Castilleja foliolosa TaxID=1961234 RepID=A0ABD3CCZ6_9LAMI
MVKICLKSSLKVLNSAIGLGGIAVIIYGILMIRVWQPENEEPSPSDQFPIPWFFHAFLVVGIALCAISGLGYVAAQTANIYYLSGYIIIVLFLLILETVIMAELFLNSNWTKELPRNLSDRLDEFKDFVDSSDDVWIWFAWLIFLVQGVSVLLATILRTLDTTEVDRYESEDENEEPNLPLLGPSSRRHPDNSHIV